MNLERNNSEQGFTLVEALVSLVILTTALIPILNLANSSLNVAFDVRDDLIAAGLTQEGIEVVRNIRDTNWFNGQAFDAGLAPGTYEVEWDSTSLLSLGSTPPLNLNNGLYTYSGGVPSAFTRTITITKVDSAELKIVSQVSWATRTNTAKTVSAEEHLFDWK